MIAHLARPVQVTVAALAGLVFLILAAGYLWHNPHMAPAALAAALVAGVAGLLAVQWREQVADRLAALEFELSGAAHLWTDSDGRQWGLVRDGGHSRVVRT